MEITRRDTKTRMIRELDGFERWAINMRDNGLFDSLGSLMIVLRLHPGFPPSASNSIPRFALVACRIPRQFGSRDGRFLYAVERILLSRVKNHPRRWRPQLFRQLLVKRTQNSVGWSSVSTLERHICVGFSSHFCLSQHHRNGTIRQQKRVRRAALEAESARFYECLRVPWYDKTPAPKWRGSWCEMR